MLSFLRQATPLFSPHERRRLGGVFLLMIGQSALELFSIALLLPVIDIALRPSRLADYPALNAVAQWAGAADPGAVLFTLAVSLVAVFLAKNVALLGLLWVLHRTVQSLQYNFRTALLSAYFLQPYARILRQNSAEIVRNLFSSTAAIFASGVLGFLTFLLELLIVLAIAAALLTIEPLGTIVAATIVGGIAAAYLAFTRIRVVEWGRRADRLIARMMRTVNEGLSTLKEIKLGRREGHFIERFRADAREAAAVRVRLALNGVAPRPIGEFVLVAAVMAIIATLTLEGRTIAEIVPVLTVFAAAGIRIMPSAARIVASVNNIREAQGPLESVLRDYRGFAPVAVPPVARVPAIRLSRALAVENLSFHYDGAATPSLAHVSLTVQRGQSVAILGRTGAGKSTLVDLILGLLEPSEGRITVDGTDIRSGLDEWQAALGYVPQVVTLIDASLRRNVAFGRPDAEIDDERVWRVMRLAQIEDFARSLPDGLATEVGERGVRLSGGQRQRIGIARALYDEPDVIVLDEATSSLDILTEHKLSQAIESVRGDKTVIVIAHRLSTVRKCDRVFVLDGGRLVAAGTFDEVVAAHPDLTRMVELDQGNAA